MSAYDDFADRYDAVLRGGSPVHALALPGLAELCGDVAGRLVCDVACGQGVLSRQLARAGARVVGVDLSLRLLTLAMEYEETQPLGIRYVCEDAQRLIALRPSTFDLITCCLALMDIPDLDAVARAIYRILKPGGAFVFAITHPCFQTPESRWTGQKGGTVRREVRGYFREGFWRSSDAAQIRGQVGAYHRTLTTYFNALTSAGFRLEALREPQPLNATADRVPGYAEVPAVLAARFLYP